MRSEEFTFSDSTSLRRTASVVRNGSYIGDGDDLQTIRVECADRGFSS